MEPSRSCSTPFPGLADERVHTASSPTHAVRCRGMCLKQLEGATNENAKTVIRRATKLKLTNFALIHGGEDCERRRRGRDDRRGDVAVGLSSGADGRSERGA